MTDVHGRRALVCGAGGFIGGHLVRQLKAEGFWARGVDLKNHEFTESPADEFIIGDLRNQDVAREAVNGIDQPAFGVQPAWMERHILPVRPTVLVAA